MTPRSALVLVAGLLLLAPPVNGQDTLVVIRPGRADVGTAAERRALAIFNTPATRRIVGADSIAPEDEVVGDVAVLDGPLWVGGTIRGRLVARITSYNVCYTKLLRALR